MDYRIVENKNVVNINGELCFDLLSKTFNNKLNQKGTILIVNKHYVARPDLISLAIYNDDSFGDVICKVNGISNPLELNENDLIFIPSLDYVRDCRLYGSSSNINDFIKTEDDEIVKIKSNYQKKIKEKRTPNEQIVGEKSYVIDKSLGLIFY